jgi:hypothetical protein
MDSHKQAIRWVSLADKGIHPGSQNHSPVLGPPAEGDNAQARAQLAQFRQQAGGCQIPQSPVK